MADLATAIIKLAETLEKFYPILDQMTRMQQQAAGATSKEGKQAQEQTQSNTTSTEGGDKEDTKNDYGKAISSGLSLAMQGFNSLNRLGHTEYAQQTTLGPVEEASKIIDGYSRAGIVMSDEHVQRVATGAAVHQNAAKANYARFDQLVDRGAAENVKRNITKKATEFVETFTNSPFDTIKELFGFRSAGREGVTVPENYAAEYAKTDLNTVRIANVNHLGE